MKQQHVFNRVSCSDSDCPICMESLDSSATVAMSCKHRFCLDCVTKVLVGTGNECGKNVCPLCRSDMVSPKTFNGITKHLAPKYDIEESDDSGESDSDDSDDESDFSIEEINVLIQEIREIKIFYQVA